MGDLGTKIRSFDKDGKPIKIDDSGLSNPTVKIMNKKLFIADDYSIHVYTMDGDHILGINKNEGEIIPSGDWLIHKTDNWIYWHDENGEQQCDQDNGKGDYVILP